MEWIDVKNQLPDVGEVVIIKVDNTTYYDNTLAHIDNNGNWVLHLGFGMKRDVSKWKKLDILITSVSN